MAPIPKFAVLLMFRPFRPVLHLTFTRAKLEVFTPSANVHTFSFFASLTIVTYCCIGLHSYQGIVFVQTGAGCKFVEEAKHRTLACTNCVLLLKPYFASLWNEAVVSTIINCEFYYRPSHTCSHLSLVTIAAGIVYIEKSVYAVEYQVLFDNIALCTILIIQDTWELPMGYVEPSHCTHYSAKFVNFLCPCFVKHQLGMSSMSSLLVERVDIHAGISPSANFATCTTLAAA